MDRLGEDLHAEGLSPLHKFNLDMERVPVPGIWRPSGLRYCMRKQVYKACKTPKQPTRFDPSRQFMFDRGHVFGAWIAAYILALEGRYGITRVDDEVVLHDPICNVGGKADIVLERAGKKYVVEFKSKDNAAAMRNIKADDKALSQLNDYMHMAGAEYGWLIYFGVDFVKFTARATKPPRTTITAKEFSHKYSESMWADTEKKSGALGWFLQDRDKLAPKTANPFFECPSCEWKWACDLELCPKAAASRTP